MPNTSKSKYDYFLDSIGNDSNIQFMNHGYLPINEKLSGSMFDSCASLYMFFLDKLKDTNDLKILDIGCGRGGGTNIIKSYYNFSEIHGCDFSDRSIDFCKKNYSGIEFSQADAESLKLYDDNQFDVVMNVESSHCYFNINSFFKEVDRVLKPNGKFLYVDVFKTPIGNENTLSKFFNIQEKFDITESTASACEDLTTKISDLLSTGVENEKAYVEMHNIYATKTPYYKTKRLYYLGYILSPRDNSSVG